MQFSKMMISYSSTSTLPWTTIRYRAVSFNKSYCHLKHVTVKWGCCNRFYRKEHTAVIHVVEALPNAVEYYKKIKYDHSSTLGNELWIGLHKMTHVSESLLMSLFTIASLAFNLSERTKVNTVLA